MSETVWLARHGNRQDFVDPDWSRTADRPHDPGLSPDGIVQAQHLGRRLRAEHIGHVVASPFLRTVETAHHVAEVLDLPILLDPGIAEWMNSAWFPQPPRRLAPERLAEQFPRIDLRYAPEGGPSFPETEEEALRRAGLAAERIAGMFPAPVLLIGHGVSVAGAVSGLVPETVITECALCSLFKVVRNGRAWQIELEGDVSHLDRKAAADRFH